MLRPRLIPCLLIHNNGLVKTTNFKDPIYIGDPINAVKLFNEKQADELIVLDIDASRNSKPPNYNLIEKLARESRMPLCYGGGIKTVNQAEKIIGLGVEKISVSSLAYENPEEIKLISQNVGAQSVVLVLDIKKTFWKKSYEVFIHNGINPTKKTPIHIIEDVGIFNFGEIVINSIDRDGTMRGYDLNSIDLIKEYISCPITLLGGVGSFADLVEALNYQPNLGLAAGSIFIFKGKYKAVLINYPDKETKMKLIIKDKNTL